MKTLIKILLSMFVALNVACAETVKIHHLKDGRIIIVKENGYGSPAFNDVNDLKEWLSKEHAFPNEKWIEELRIKAKEVELLDSELKTVKEFEL